MPDDQSRTELYRRRAERFTAEAAGLARRSRLVGNLRGLSFGVAVISGLFAAFGSAPVVAAIVALAGSLTFAALLVVHARVIAAEDEAWRWTRVNRDAWLRASDRWQELPDDGAALAGTAHPYADDLDLFGPSSLYQRLSVAHTRFGQTRLAAYLTEVESLDAIRARQEAARALAPELELRQELEALALAAAEPNPLPDQVTLAPAGASGVGGRARRHAEAPDPEPLLVWAESPPRLAKRRGVVFLAHALPVSLAVAITVATVWDLPAVVWVLPLFLQLVLNFQTREDTGRVFGAVSATEGAFLRYGAMLALLERMDLPSRLLGELRASMLTGQTRPSLAMKRFRNLVGWFDLRHNGLVHPFANAFLLWDIHCVLRLERWQRDAGKNARRWFVALGEFEALASLAALAHDESGFVFAELAEGSGQFDAAELGHPLISADSRVSNDVCLANAGSMLLVTGSNMSGKSTLLRAMGLAAVMALAGGPACASRLRISRCHLRTSIRVRDSLEGGVSHFYAELRKLKAVLDATEKQLPVLFLLDEILHGTNSRERQIGARWVLTELVTRGAIGAASTHDLGLAQLPESLSDRVTLVHFRESVVDGEMTFDYRLRPGPVTAGNALELMRRVGLHVPRE